MTWTKTPDDYPDRLLELSDAAYRLHHVALTYANRLGLDGRIPKARLGLLPVQQRTRRPATARELVDAGRWRDDGDAWTIVDFLTDQPSAEEVASERAYNAIRQRARLQKAGPAAAALRIQVDASRAALFAARERRKAQSHTASCTATSTATRISPDPSRPVPLGNEDEDERDRPDVRALEARTPAGPPKTNGTEEIDPRTLTSEQYDALLSEKIAARLDRRPA